MLNVVFAIYFFRHLAFAVAALRWGDDDLRLRAPLPTGGTCRRWSVLVGCRTRSWCSRASSRRCSRCDYPVDRLEILFVDDGSDDGTGDLLDG